MIGTGLLAIGLFVYNQMPKTKFCEGKNAFIPGDSYVLEVKDGGRVDIAYQIQENQPRLVGIDEKNDGTYEHVFLRTPTEDGVKTYKLKDASDILKGDPKSTKYSIAVQKAMATNTLNRIKKICADGKK